MVDGWRWLPQPGDREGERLWVVGGAGAQVHGESGKNLLLLWEKERETDPGRKLGSHHNRHPRNYLKSVKISDQKPCVLALLVPQKRGLRWDPRVCEIC